MNQATVSKAIAAGILTRGATAQQWNREWISRLEEQAAGRMGDGPLDLVQERANLAAKQSEKIELELAERRGSLVPLGHVVDFLKQHNVIWRQRLLTLPGKLGSKGIDRRAAGMVDNEVRDLLTEISQAKFKLPAGGEIEPGKAKAKKPAKKAPLARRKRTPKRSASAQSAQGRRPRKPSGGQGKGSD